MTRRAVTTRVQQRDYGTPLQHVDHTGTYTAAQLDEQGWKLRGACAGRPEHPWFDRANGTETHHARRFCGGCPVARMCLAAALVFAEEYGTWGGHTPTDRQPLAAQLLAGIPLRAVLDHALAGDDTARKRSA